MLKALRYLKTLFLTKNDFIFTRDLDGPRPFFNQAVHCDCSIIALRNYSWQVFGRCSSPPEVRGYHVTCFPINTCIRTEPLYLYSNTIAECKNSNFINFTLAYAMRDNVPTIVYRQAGVDKQTYLEVELFSKNRSIEQHKLHYNDVKYTFISSKLSESDFTCVTATFTTNATMKKCLTLPLHKNANTLASFHNPETIVLGSLLSVSIVVNMIAFLLILNIFRRKSNPKSLNTVKSDLDQTVGGIYDNYVESRESHMCEGVPDPPINVESNEQTSKETALNKDEPGIAFAKLKAELIYTNSAFN